MPAPKYFQHAGAFRQWLKDNASSETELLVGFHKVDSGKPSMSWSESVDEALCFGWIDGVRKRVDDARYTIRFSPRKPTSIWSAINIAKMARLQKAGRMTAAGLDAFAKRQEAKSNIYAYEQEQTAELSPDELRTFKRCKVAWKYFESCPPSYRKVVVHWIVNAKKAETRAARLEKLTGACGAQERLK